MKELNQFIIKTYLWAAEQLYHNFAWAYDFVAWLVSFGNWSKWRKDASGYLQPGEVLEIGFGTGSLLVAMTVQGLDVFGVEPSHQMLRMTKKRSKKEDLSPKIVQARAQAMPFSNGAFDNLILTFPSNYIFDDETLREMSRILTHVGRVVITGFGVEFKSDILNFLTGWFLNDGRDLFIREFCQKAEKLRFKSGLVQHNGESYTLPIVILEKKNDK